MASSFQASAVVLSSWSSNRFDCLTMAQPSEGSDEEVIFISSLEDICGCGCGCNRMPFAHASDMLLLCICIAFASDLDVHLFDAARLRRSDITVCF